MNLKLWGTVVLQTLKRQEQFQQDEGEVFQAERDHSAQGGQHIRAGLAEKHFRGMQKKNICCLYSWAVLQYCHILTILLLSGK